MFKKEKIKISTDRLTICESQKTLRKNDNMENLKTSDKTKLLRMTKFKFHLLTI